MAKTKEELLSDEVRAFSDAVMKWSQWGVTLMVSLMTALFFIRREILVGYIEAGKLPKGSELPADRYLIGTVFLLIMAGILTKLSARNLEQYRHYKGQLASSRESGITDLPIKYAGRWMYGLFFLFPAIDFGLKVIIAIDIKLAG